MFVPSGTGIQVSVANVGTYKHVVTVGVCRCHLREPGFASGGE
jgi:hypothetical protein